MSSLGTCPSRHTLHRGAVGEGRGRRWGPRQGHRRLGDMNNWGSCFKCLNELGPGEEVLRDVQERTSEWQQKKKCRRPLMTAVIRGGGKVFNVSCKSWWVTSWARQHEDALKPNFGRNLMHAKVFGLILCVFEPDADILPQQLGA